MDVNRLKLYFILISGITITSCNKILFNPDNLTATSDSELFAMVPDEQKDEVTIRICTEELKNRVEGVTNIIDITEKIIDMYPVTSNRIGSEGRELARLFWYNEDGWRDRMFYIESDRPQPFDRFERKHGYYNCQIWPGDTSGIDKDRVRGHAVFNYPMDLNRVLEEAGEIPQRRSIDPKIEPKIDWTQDYPQLDFTGVEVGTGYY